MKKFRELLQKGVDLCRSKYIMGDITSNTNFGASSMSDELRDFVDSREGFGDLYSEWEDYMDWQERNEAERYNPFDEGHDADDAAFASEGLDDHGQWHDHAEYYDHEPNPYHGDYSEE